MKYLSYFISENTPLYGNGTGIQFMPDKEMSKNDICNTMNLSFPNHSCTHVDVPYHFFEDGKTITDYPPSFWVFDQPQCLDVPSEDGYLVIFEDIKEQINDNTDLLLFRTGYEKYRNESRYWQKNPGLSQNLAKELRSKFPHIRAVGIDTISITSLLHRKEGRKAHREFLGNHHESDPVVLIEDMTFKNYDSHITQVIVLPLMIAGADGAPCTIIAQ